MEMGMLCEQFFIVLFFLVEHGRDNSEILAWSTNYVSVG